MEISISHFGPENDQYQECLKIRYEVLRKPLGMEILDSDREKDAVSTHILCRVNGVPAGTVALKEGVLRQMAVLDKYQGLGLGRKLVGYLEKLAGSRSLNEITLDARENAIVFYEKLGYECISNFYEQIGILHKDMKKSL